MSALFVVQGRNKKYGSINRDFWQRCYKLTGLAGWSIMQIDILGGMGMETKEKAVQAQTDKSLEQHPIGMAGQTDIRFPNDLYSIGTVYNLQNSTVCTMAFPRQRQTSVKCDPELFCSGVLFQK